MEKSKLVLYSQDDIMDKINLIKHNNAFILPNGKFYIAKGYTGCNPSHQLESSALAIARNDIMTEYISSYEKDGKNIKKGFHYLRSALVHYYGYTLFARTELIKAFNDRNRFIDHSLIPNPKYYDKEATLMQIATLEKLFEINNDGTLITGYFNPTSQYIFQKVLSHNNNNDNWHY